MKFKATALTFAISAGLMLLLGTLLWGAPQAALKVGVIAALYASVMGGAAGTVKLTKNLPEAAVRDVLRAALIFGGGLLVTSAFTGHLILQSAPPGQAASLIMMMIAYLGVFAGMAGGAYRVLRNRRKYAVPNAPGKN